MGKGSSGSGQNTVIQNSQPPQAVLDQYNQVLAAGNNVAAQPLQQYTGNLVAGFTPQQQQAFSEIQNAQGAANPFINSGASLLSTGANPINVAGGMSGDQITNSIGTGINQINQGNTSIQAGTAQAAGAGALSSPYVQNGESLINQGANGAGIGVGQGTAQINQGAALTAAAPGVSSPYIQQGTGLMEQGAGMAASSLGLSSPYVQQGMGNIQQGAAQVGNSASYLNSAMGSSQFDPSQTSQYFSPYMQSAVAATQAAQNNQDAQQQQQVIGNAVSQGAWGGDRSAVAQGIMAGQQAIANNQTISGMENTGYQTALGTQQAYSSLGANTGLGAANANTQAGLGLVQSGTAAANAGLGLGNQAISAGQAMNQAGSNIAQTGLGYGNQYISAGQGLTSAGNANVQAGLGYGNSMTTAGQAAGNLGLGYGNQAISSGQAQIQGGTAGVGAGNANLALAENQQQQGVGAAQASGWLAQNAGNSMANLGNQAQSTALSGANAELQSGALQQQLNQEQLNIPYQEWQQQQAYPFQTTSWLSNLSTGIGGASGGTSSTTTPGASTVSQLGGLGMAGLGAGLAMARRGGRIQRAYGGEVAGFTLPDVPNVNVSFSSDNPYGVQSVKQTQNSIPEYPAATPQQGMTPGQATSDMQAGKGAYKLYNYLSGSGAPTVVGQGVAGMGAAQAGGVGQLMAGSGVSDAIPMSSAGSFMGTGSDLGSFGTGMAATPTTWMGANAAIPSFTSGMAASGGMGADLGMSTGAAGAATDAAASSGFWSGLGDSLMSLFALKNGGRVGFDGGGAVAVTTGDQSGMAAPGTNGTGIPVRNNGVTVPQLSTAQPVPANMFNSDGSINTASTTNYAPPDPTTIAAMGKSTNISINNPTGKTTTATGTSGGSASDAAISAARPDLMAAYTSNPNMFGSAGTFDQFLQNWYGAMGSGDSSIASYMNSATDPSFTGFEQSFGTGKKTGGRVMSALGGVPRYHRDGGGGLVDPGLMNSGVSAAAGVAPMQQNLAGQFSKLPVEQLQEMSVRFPPTTPQGQMARRVLQSKLMAPQTATQPQSGMGMAAGGRMAFDDGGDVGSDSVIPTSSIAGTGAARPYLSALGHWMTDISSPDSPGLIPADQDTQNIRDWAAEHGIRGYSANAMKQTFPAYPTSGASSVHTSEAPPVTEASPDGRVAIQKAPDAPPTQVGWDSSAPTTDLLAQGKAAGFISPDGKVPVLDTRAHAPETASSDAAPVGPVPTAAPQKASPQAPVAGMGPPSPPPPAAASAPAQPYDPLAGYTKGSDPFQEMQPIEKGHAQKWAENPWLPVIQAGLAMAAGRSPSALTNVATGLTSGMQSLQTQRNQEEEDAKAQQALADKNQQIKKMNMDADTGAKTLAISLNKAKADQDYRTKQLSDAEAAQAANLQHQKFQEGISSAQLGIAQAAEQRAKEDNENVPGTSFEYNGSIHRLNADESGYETLDPADNKFKPDPKFALPYGISNGASQPKPVEPRVVSKDMNGAPTNIEDPQTHTIMTADEYTRVLANRKAGISDDATMPRIDPTKGNQLAGMLSSDAKAKAKFDKQYGKGVSDWVIKQYGQ